MIALLFMLLTADKFTPQELNKVAVQGKGKRYENLVNASLQTMYADAQDGELCSLLFFHSKADADYVEQALVVRKFRIEHFDSKNIPEFKVCWNGETK